MRHLEHVATGANWTEREESTHDSIELSQNAKGLWQATIKVYFEPSQGGQALGQARAYLDSIRELGFRLVEPAEPPSTAKTGMIQMGVRPEKREGETA